MTPCVVTDRSGCATRLAEPALRQRVETGADMCLWLHSGMFDLCSGHCGARLLGSAYQHGSLAVAGQLMLMLMLVLSC